MLLLKFNYDLSNVVSLNLKPENYIIKIEM